MNGMENKMKLVIKLNREDFEVPNTKCQFCNKEVPLRPDVKEVYCINCGRKIGGWNKGDFIREEGKIKLIKKLKEIYNGNKAFVYDINCD